MTAQTAKERLRWVLAKDHERGTRFLTHRDIGILGIERLSDVSIPCLTIGGAAWRGGAFGGTVRVKSPADDQPMNGGEG